LGAHRGQLPDQGIALGPDADCLIHEADVAKTPEERGHSLDILRVIAPQEEPQLHAPRVGIGAFELQPGFAITQWDRQALPERGVLCWIGIAGVPDQVIDRIPLRLGPEALASHVGAG
jgi:hypothetical protein